MTCNSDLRITIRTGSVSDIARDFSTLPLPTAFCGLSYASISKSSLGSISFDKSCEIGGLKSSSGGNLKLLLVNLEFKILVKNSISE